MWQRERDQNVCFLLIGSRPAKLFKIDRNKSGFKKHNGAEFSTLVLKRLQTEHIFASFVDFLEVIRSTFAQQGVRRDKKENFSVSRVVFFFPQFSICLCINCRAFPF